MDEDKHYSSLELCPGGVPAGEYFSMMLWDLRSLLSTNGNSRSLRELCFSGATSYFEVFFKDVFATSLNIAPLLLENMRKNHDINVDPLLAIELGGDISRKVGFLISDKHDFGTPEKVNKLYTALMKVTPFSTDEKAHYDKIQAMRNLIVHHGGVYNTKYRPEKFSPSLEAKHNMFYNGITVTEGDIEDLIEFMARIARRTVRASKEAIQRFVDENKVFLEEDRSGALSYLGMWSSEEEYHDNSDCFNDEPLQQEN